MRPTTSLLVGLLFILSVASCVDVSRYLNTGESVSKEETFAVDGSFYTLIYVGGDPTLLLDNNGNLVSDSSIISRVLMVHFSEMYYPSQSELNALRADFDAYEASRNNGDYYRNASIKLPGMNRSVGIEEEVCRYSLFLNVFPCTNSTNCIYSAMMLCDEFGDALGCSDPRDLQPHVEKFSFADIGMTRDMNRIFALLNNMSSRNIYASLTEIKALTGNIDDYEKDLEGTKFRLPQGGEKCNDCYGLCPRILINESFLESATEKIDAMLEDTALLGDYNAQGVRMGGEAVERLGMANTNAQKAYYHTIYDPQKNRSREAVADARNLLAMVSNGTIGAYADRIDALIAKTDADLAAGDFSQVNASLDELRAKTGMVEGAIPGQWEIYNNAEKAEAEASLSLFILETSTLSDEQGAVVASLSARKSALDRGFVSGLTPERYLELADDYQNITETARPMVEQVEQGTAYMSPFKAAGRKTNEGLESLVVTLSPMDRTERGEFAGYAPLMLSAVSFFSLASLLTFAFLFVFASMSTRFRKRSTMFMGFAVLGVGLLLVGAVSAGVYFTVKGSSSDADFNEFRSSLGAVDHATVLVDTQGVSAGAVADMRGCAGKIAGALAPRTVEIYQKTDGDCITSENTTLGECYNSVEEPIITLKYSSAQERPDFSAVFVDSATFYGDEMFFRDCEFAQMLAVGLEMPAAEAQPEAAGNESGDWVIE